MFKSSEMDQVLQQFPQREELGPYVLHKGGAVCIGDGLRILTAFVDHISRQGSNKDDPGSSGSSEDGYNHLEDLLELILIYGAELPHNVESAAQLNGVNLTRFGPSLEERVVEQLEDDCAALRGFCSL